MGRNSKQYLCSTKTKLSSGYGEVSDKLNIEQPLKYGGEAIKKIAKYWTSFIIDVIFISEEVLNFEVIIIFEIVLIFQIFLIFEVVSTFPDGRCPAGRGCHNVKISVCLCVYLCICVSVCECCHFNLSLW